MDILQTSGTYEVVGLLDSNPDLWGSSILGVTVLGNDDLLPELYRKGLRWAFIGLGTLGDTRRRKELYSTIAVHGFRLVSAIHPRAVVSSSAQLGEGPTVMAGAVINAAAVVGDDVTINTGAIVEHDCVIGNHVHIATGARLGGGVRVGESSHVGLGASIRQGISIGKTSMVGAGAVVVHDVPDNVVVTGVPARVTRAFEE
jgi:UDP-perosamine 4-acetyltransferase